MHGWSIVDSVTPMKRNGNDEMASSQCNMIELEAKAGGDIAILTTESTLDKPLCSVRVTLRCQVKYISKICVGYTR